MTTATEVDLTIDDSLDKSSTVEFDIQGHSTNVFSLFVYEEKMRKIATSSPEERLIGLSLNKHN